MELKILLVVIALNVGMLACARIDEERSERAVSGGVGPIMRADPAIETIVPEEATIEKLAGGFGFTEGPVWTHGGVLLFSDIPNNAILKWAPEEEVTVFRKPSGYYNGEDQQTASGLLGSNGLTLDQEGRLTICEHGNRRVTRLEKDGSFTVLADRYEGKRLNSPNDAVYRSDGSLYFTDPPYGLAEQDEDPSKELDFNGVYRLHEGELQLLDDQLTRPNGLAFSPDEEYLYVANSDRASKIWMRFPVQADGTLGEGTVFYDVTSETEDGLPDGMKVDQQGNLYCTGPGGVWIFSPEGTHLGTIKPPEIPANCAWGDEEGSTLYITARTGLYRIRLNIPGVHP